MDHRFSLFEVVLLAGIAQGFVISVLTWLYKRDNHSKVLLSFLLIVFNFICFKILLHTTGLWQTSFFRYFPLPFELAIGPMAWMYVRSLTDTRFRVRANSLVHFIPLFISLVYSIVVYVATQYTDDLRAKDVIAWDYSFNDVKRVEDYLSVISATVYWLLGFRIVLRYRAWLYREVSDTRYPTYTWLRNISILLGVLIVILGVDILIDLLSGVETFLHWQFFFVYLALLIYYMGMRGYALAEEVLVAGDRTVPEQRVAVLPDAAMEALSGVILHAMDVQKLYLDPELTLSAFARATGTPAPAVSAAINQHFQKTFRVFVNDYRVAMVKERLASPDARRLSLLGIAYECGFNSEASFYRIFKQATGMSPKAFMEQHAQ